MLAGRKLLLADDSATIQKVIDLTFADEGVRVLAVSSGQEALERIKEFAPDIVLADVFMPSPDGYEVCRYVKTNEELKHIPVMLLVGSFEPFDEAEARRVGADDILTKPFSSIRRLIDRVGALVSGPPADAALEKEGPTAELPEKEDAADDSRLNTAELEMITADTMPLPDDVVIDTLRGSESPAGESPMDVTPSARLEALLQSPAGEGKSEHEGRMEPGMTETKSETEPADVLLDLGDIEPGGGSPDEFVLDLEDAGVDDAPAYTPASAYKAPMRAFVEPKVTEAPTPVFESTYQPQIHSPLADTQEVPQAVTEIEPYEAAAASPEPAPDPEPVLGEAETPRSDTPQPATSINAAQLSPEMIDAIARRAVEMMSDKVIREIAWEVVPDLAELLIKRQLEENQAK